MKASKSGTMIPRPGAFVALALCGSILCALQHARPAGAATDQAQSQDPAAIVEAIDAATVPDLGPMDYLYEGMELALGESGSITVAYLRTCRVERITGGLVKIGQRRSEVSSPTPIEVAEVNCDGGGIVPTDRQSEDSAGATFRSASSGDEPPVKVYSTQPVFLFAQPIEELVIKREDPGREKVIVLPVTGKHLDLAEQRVSLDIGGLYRAESGDRSVRFKIPRSATRFSRTIVERLIGF